MPDGSALGFLWNTVRILVVDDESEMREIFRTWLHNLGCQVTEANDGQEALEKARQETFDVIVTDVRMPRLDGVELAKRLREEVEYVPVLIFVSGFHDLPAVDAHEMGIEAILSKPCTKKQLIQSVRASLLRRELRFEEEAPLSVPAAPQIEDSFPCSVEESQVAVGRGGFSVTSRVHPGLENYVTFRLDFGEGILRRLEGTGVIRWVEPFCDLKRVGVEFVGLTEQTRDELRVFLHQRRPHSFIPKGCVSSRSAANAQS